MKPFDVKAFAAAWNTHEPARILGFYAPNTELFVPPDTEPYRGHEGVRKNIEEVMGGIEELNGDIEWSVQEGNRVSMLVHVTGRHDGPLVISEEAVVPATGRDVDFLVGIFLELDADGKIRKETDIADNLSLMTQVGAKVTAGPARAARPGQV